MNKDKVTTMVVVVVVLQQCEANVMLMSLCLT